jgi:hypothetical protein
VHKRKSQGQDRLKKGSRRKRKERIRKGGKKKEHWDGRKKVAGSCGWKGE